MTSIVSSIKDAANPFVRLVASATVDDQSTGAPFYLLEQLREASFQSEYGCESIHRALFQRLDSYRGYPFVVSKVLGVIRMLMLEGPSQFNLRMGQSSASIVQLISHWNCNPDAIRRGSLEERNRDLAQAIHSAIGGDAKALQRFGQEGGALSGSAASSGSQQGAAGMATTVTGRVLTCKSDYQAQQEKEQRLYKKRMEEERSKDPLVVQDRLMEVFDGTLPPQKLVDSVVLSPKKKFSKEELDSFVVAAQQCGKISDICNALDAVLRDGKASLQSRFKILTIVDVLVHQPSPIAEVILFFKAHTLGLTRHMTIERADNPVKAEAAKGIAQNVVATLQKVVVTTPPAATGVAAGRPRGSSTVSQQQQQSSTSAPTAVLPPHHQLEQWTWNGPNNAPTGSASVDDLFSNLTITKKPSGGAAQQLQHPQQQPQSSWDSLWSQQGGTAMSVPGPSPAAVHQPPATPPFGVQLVATPSPSLGFTAPNNSFAAPWGGSQSGQASFTGLPAPNASMASVSAYHGGASFVQPPVPNTSLCTAPPTLPSAPVPVPAAPVSQADLVRIQMEDMQKQMARMMQQILQQQQQQQSAPSPQQQQQSSQPAAPSPQQQQCPVLSAASDGIVAVPPTNPNAAAADVAAANVEKGDVKEEGGEDDYHMPPQRTHTPPPHHNATPPSHHTPDGIVNRSASNSATAGHAELQPQPHAAPGSTTTASPQAAPQVQPQPQGAMVDQAAAMAMMLQLQQQMAATQQMLAQQQQAFQALQAQLFQPAQHPSSN